MLPTTRTAPLITFALSLPGLVLAVVFSWATDEIHHLLAHTAFRLSLELAGDLSAVRAAANVMAGAAGTCAFSVLVSWAWSAHQFAKQFRKEVVP